MIRTCIQCGREFEARHAGILLCSNECRRERIKARNNSYYAANPERTRAKVKAWREANRESALATDKAYREANREIRAAKNKAYYEQNAERLSARGKQRRDAGRKLRKEFNKI
jgi:hypothetical protein